MIEVERNLQAKAPHAVPTFLVFQRSGLITLVDPPSKLVAQIATVIEPKDAPVIAAAVAAETSFLASYDRKHLLSQASLISEQFRLIVDTPDHLLQMLMT